ncbi:hypothetical protein MHYP_G00064530 [Metynnis hypsauchen]
MFSSDKQGSFEVEALRTALGSVRVRQSGYSHVTSVPAFALSGGDEVQGSGVRAFRAAPDRKHSGNTDRLHGIHHRDIMSIFQPVTGPLLSELSTVTACLWSSRLLAL